MVALPVSGLHVTLRRPAGEEDVLLFEAPRRDMRLAVALLSRLASEESGELRCEALPVADVEVLLLELRRLMFGEWVRGEAACPSRTCGARVDVSFRVGDYLAHHAPRPVRDVQPDGEEGWLTLRNAPVRFRLPLAADCMAVNGRPDAERLMIARCVDPPELPQRLLGRVARALSLLAPPLADVVQGRCPECGSDLAVYFDPQDFTLRELRGEASLVFEEVHLLASRYHWSEASIMSMPRARRAQYAELIQREGRA